MNENPDTPPAAPGATTTAAPSADWPVVACTGHRDLTDDDLAWTVQTLTRVAARLHEQCGTRVAISGFARQADLVWADAALRAGMRLWAAIPHDKQAARFPKADRAEWARLRALAEYVFVAGEVGDDVPPKQRSSATNKLIWQRNTAMVKAADAMVGVWDGRLSGGTHGTLLQAAKRDMPGVWVNPVARTVRGHLPTLAELEPFAVYHGRCGHIWTVALRAEADRELGRLHRASYPAWKIRRAKPREDDSIACTTCYIHPDHLNVADADTPPAEDLQEALL